MLILPYVARGWKQNFLLSLNITKQQKIPNPECIKLGAEFIFINFCSLIFKLLDVYSIEAPCKDLDNLLLGDSIRYINYFADLR